MKQLQMPLFVSNHILYINKVYELYLSMRKSGITDQRKEGKEWKKIGVTYKWISDQSRLCNSIYGVLGLKFYDILIFIRT